MRSLKIGVCCLLPETFSLRSARRLSWFWWCLPQMVSVSAPSPSCEESKAISTQDHLNHLMTLNIYQDQLDKLDMIAVANEFCRKNEHRSRFLAPLLIKSDYVTHYLGFFTTIQCMLLICILAFLDCSFGKSAWQAPLCAIITEWLKPWSGWILFWIIWRRWSQAYQWCLA